MSKKDTLAWRVPGRGRRVPGPEETGEAVQKVLLFFKPVDGAVTAVSARKRPVNSFLARSEC